MIKVTEGIEVTTHDYQLPELSEKLMDMLFSIEDRVNNFMHSEVVRWSGVSYSTVRAVATGRYNVSVKTIIALDVALDKLEWIAANAGNSRKMKEAQYLEMRQAKEGIIPIVDHGTDSEGKNSE